VAQNQSYGTAENATLSEPAGALQSGVSDPNPTATSWAASKVSSPTHGTATVNPNGSFTYTPTTGFIGTDSFTYTLTDNLGFTSAPATVSISVTTSCNVNLWPKKIRGFPIVKPGSPSAFYIGESGSYFSLYTSHPAAGNKAITETGTITIGPQNANVQLSNLRLRKGEADDHVMQVNQWTVKFNFLTLKSLDGMTFNAACGSTLNFTLQSNSGAGKPLTQTPHTQIHLGRPTSSPLTNPFTETR
jgi:VCBS repeat-containing protein